MPATAVLDVGKTNVKLVLFEGPTVLWQASRPNRPLPGPPYPHIDVEAIWRFFTDGLREAAASHAIGDLIVTTHGAAFALVGDDGLALPAMDYEFAGVDLIEAEYESLRPPFSETLTPPMAAGLNGGRQIFYQQKHCPVEFASVRHIVGLPQYFTWRLTGIARSEVTGLSGHSDLWAMRERRLSSLVHGQGWERLFPAFVPAHEVLGPPTEAVQARTGLSSAVRVRAGIHDSNASLLPHLLEFTPPFTLVSTGTWVVIMAAGGDPACLDPARDMQAYADIEARPLPAAKFMGGREFAILLETDSPECDESDIAAVMAAGAMALPSFVPHGGAYSGRPGEIRGQLPTGKGVRAALASLYCAMMTDYLLDLLDARRGPLLIEGSFSANRCYGALLAAIRPDQAVLSRVDGGGTAYGASLLAGWPKRPGQPGLSRATAFANAEAALSYRRKWREALA